MLRLKESLEKKGCLPIIIKCEKLLPLDEVTFFKNLVDELKVQLVKVSKKEKTKEVAKLFLPEKIGVSVEDIHFWIEFGKGEIKNLKKIMEKTFDLTNKIGAVTKRKVIIFLDEFQELFPFGDAFLWALRAHINESKALFIVCSSHHRFIANLTQEKHPFFNFFQTYEIKGVSDDDAELFLKSRIEKLGVRYEQQAIQKILYLSNGHPYYIQLLGFWCYELALSLNKRVIDEKVLSLAYSESLQAIPAHLISSFEKLKGKTRSVFVVLCLYDLSSVSGIAKHAGLDPKAAYQLLQQIESSYGLVKRNAENKFEVTDLFLKAYVQKLFDHPVMVP